MAIQFIVAFDTGIETAFMTTKRPSISVVYPMFNEEENIERAVHFAEVVLTDMTSDYEILIVNDASTDRSAEIAEALARSRPCVKVFHHERNPKLVGALRTGFSKATKELVFYCDSDLPVDLAELNRAVHIMEFTRSDLVSAFRFDRTAEGPLRTLYSVVYNLVIRFLFSAEGEGRQFFLQIIQKGSLKQSCVRVGGFVHRRGTADQRQVTRIQNRAVRRGLLIRVTCL